MIEEDWEVLVSLFPEDWRKMAAQANVLKGLRKDKSEENLLRTLLIHLAGGHSLRETALRARQAQLADISDVALLKRLRKCQEWLARLCAAMLVERGITVGAAGDLEVRLFDGTTVKEPGKTGSLWRIHYSVRIPSLRCDFFRVTAVDGQGTGESLKQFPVGKDEHIIADRGYGTASGIEYVSRRNGSVMVRMSPHNLQVNDTSGRPLNWKERLGEIQQSAEAHSWSVWLPVAHEKHIEGRVCAVRKTEEAIRQAHKRLQRRANKNGQRLRPETLLYAEYVIVFTTFSEIRFPPSEVMRWYRLRWQIELVFKRFKQIAQLGHLPKYDEESAKAWLYGKLFVVLTTEKLIWQARSFSPWGCLLVRDAMSESLA
jgi:hypothetical protein